MKSNSRSSNGHELQFQLVGAAPGSNAETKINVIVHKVIFLIKTFKNAYLDCFYQGFSAKNYWSTKGVTSAIFIINN